MKDARAKMKQPHISCVTARPWLTQDSVIWAITSWNEITTQTPHSFEVWDCYETGTEML